MDSIVERVYKSSLKFLVPLGVEDTFALIISEAMRLTKADYGSIFLEKDGELERVYASSPFLYDIKIRKQGYTYTVFKNRKSIVLTSKEIAKIHPQINDIKAHSDIIVPLFYRNKSVGVLTVMSHKTNFFTDKDMQLLELFSPLASLVIKKTQLYEETRQALDTRDHFISMAAHELRTPLTSIHGYIQLLHSKLKKGEAVESRWVEHLYGESVRLTNLVNELLAVNRIKTGKFQYLWKECSLREIINRAVDSFKFSAPHRSIIFDDQLKNTSDSVIGDYDKLLQVILNLLDNATKFSPPETEIIVKLWHKSPCLRIDIHDKGKGIKKEEIDKITDIFYKGSNHTTEGMGFGMFLVKNIIAEHHGVVEIKSKPNKGTIVEIRLPKVKL